MVATSLFDTGNAFVCLGGAYSVAVVTKEKNARFSLLPVVKTLLKSLPFDAYLIMTCLLYTSSSMDWCCMWTEESWLTSASSLNNPA